MSGLTNPTTYHEESRHRLSPISSGDGSSASSAQSYNGSDDTLMDGMYRPRYGTMQSTTDDDDLESDNASMQFDFTPYLASNIDSRYQEKFGRTASVVADNPLVEENKDEIFRDALYMLFKYNCPAPTVRAYAEELAKALGIPTNILLRPTGFWLCNGLEKAQYIFVNRVYNVNKMSQAVKIATNIIKMRTTYGLQLRLRRIETDDPCYPWWAMLISFPLYGIGFSGFFFNGDLNAAITAMTAGWAIALMNAVWMHGFLTEWGNLKCILCSVVASLVCMAMCVAGYVTPPCAFSAMLGAIAVDFPGISIAMASLEMMAGTVVMGATRFAISTFQGEQIAIACLAGYHIVSALGDYDEYLVNMFDGECTGVHNVGVQLLFYPFLFVAAILYYDVPLKHALPLFLVQFPCYLSYFFLSKTQLGSYGGTAIACFVMVVLSWVTAALFDDHGWTSISALTPTIELLVPGSSVVRSSVFQFLNDPKKASFGNAYIITAIALASGITAGDAFLQTCRLRRMYNVPVYKGPLNAYNASSFDLELYIEGLPEDVSDYALVTITRASVRTSRRFAIYSPYVQITVDDAKHSVCRSSTKHDCADPQWNELFLVPVAFEKGSDTSSIVLDMRNYHEYATNTKLGSLTFDLRKGKTRYGMTSRSMAVNGIDVVLDSVDDAVVWEGRVTLQSDRYDGEMELAIVWSNRPGVGGSEDGRRASLFGDNRSNLGDNRSSMGDRRSRFGSMYGDGSIRSRHESTLRRKDSLASVVSRASRRYSVVGGRDQTESHVSDQLRGMNAI